MLGAPLEAQLTARSLAGVVLGTQPALDSIPAYSEDEITYYNYGWSDLRALRDENYRYIRAPKPELYDLRADPGETHNLITDEPQIAERYAALLRKRLPAQEKNTRTSESGRLEPEVQSALAALGYTLSDAAPGNDADRPDPKDQLHDLLAQQHAESLMHAGRLEEAEAAYRAVLASNIRAIAVRDALANVLTLRGKLAEALEIQRGSLTLPGSTVGNFLIVAELEFRLGIEGWRHSLEVAKEFNPRAPMPWVREGDLVHLPANPEAALAAYRSALERDDHCAPAWLGISHVEALRRNAKGALEAAVRATELDPKLVEAWFLRGSMNAAGGNRDEAIACFARARDLEPADVKPRMALALLRVAAGDEAAALTELRDALSIAPEQVRQAAAGNAVLLRLLERAK
ncbi:MAG: tetratricopeptide repeat protein [Planctomycetes bacterium]|nr:tetratricopeptide repeat protein [Planctomycetota bacterium]